MIRSRSPAIVVLLLPLAWLQGVAPATRRPEPLLSTYALDPAPWLTLDAGSERRPPVYLGASPVALTLDGTLAPRPRLPRRLRALGESQARRVLATFAHPTALELEAWPVEDDDGRRWTWQFARWRAGPDDRWRWIEGPPAAADLASIDPAPLVTRVLHPEIPDERALLLDDFLAFVDLQQKRLFGEAVFTDRAREDVVGAWLPLRSAETYDTASLVAHIVRQPARWNAMPVSFVLAVASGSIAWPPGIEWVEPDASPATPDVSPRAIASWPPDLEAALRADVLALDGEREAVFPLSGRRARFLRRNAADPDHQLGAVVDYLEERYHRLGLATRRERFRWRGIEETNLIAIVPGRDPSRPPVLLADHIDTAFAEDRFEATHERRSVPGADDDASGTAALLEGAALLRDARLDAPVWLVHFTGEEYPGDDLGARDFLARRLRARERLGGLVLLDMIGWHEPDDRLFQVSEGATMGSRRLAKAALGAARRVAPELEATWRGPGDARSYLYNTDGLVFDEVGSPVILLNEHLNALENLDRPHYHRSTDVAATVDFAYAAAVARVAVETVAALAR